MAEERRINLRVSHEEFKRLNDKRHAAGTTFQDVGITLFRSWLDDGILPASEPPAQLPSPLAALDRADLFTVSCVADILYDKHNRFQGPVFRILRSVLKEAEQEYTILTKNTLHKS